MDISSPRWRRRKQARPQEILDAALVCFAEKGFAAARMDDIADQAGVTKGTIYLYFKNKEAVFKALVRESIGVRVDEILEQVRKSNAPARDILRMMVSNLGTILHGNNLIVLPKIVLAEAGNFPELARFYREEIVDKGLSAIMKVISRGIERGEFRPIAPQFAARLLVAPVLIVVFWRTTFAQFDTEPFDHEGFLKTHIEVLLRGLAPDGEASP
ncbi:MAG TPA: TetR/AcrR family transcriptional regulator [Rhizomicrobium sp.]|jgi:AcrR family transcriptional regulator